MNHKTSVGLPNQIRDELTHQLTGVVKNTGGKDLKIQKVFGISFQQKDEPKIGINHFSAKATYLQPQEEGFSEETADIAGTFMLKEACLDTKVVIEDIDFSFNL